MKQTARTIKLIQPSSLLRLVEKTLLEKLKALLLVFKMKLLCSS